MPSDPLPNRPIAPATLTTLTTLPVGDTALYRQALTHRSLLRGRPDSHRHSNERLEFLGDALLGVIVGEALYHAFPDEPEGFLSRLRAKLVSTEALARYARQMNLGAHLFLTDNVAQNNGRDNANILADAFEALIGAVYLDHDFGAARTFVEARALNTVDLEGRAQREDNYKSRLQEHLQAEQRPVPTYRVVEATGPSHDRTFTVVVEVEGTPYGKGTAGAKQRAEQRAAREALETLRAEDAPET